METKKTLPTYTFELDYDKSNYTVDKVMEQLHKWQNTSWLENVSYMIADKEFWVLKMFTIRSKELKIYITWQRHAGILAKKLWLKFNPDKYKYQKDLFDLWL